MSRVCNTHLWELTSLTYQSTHIPNSLKENLIVIVNALGPVSGRSVLSGHWPYLVTLFPALLQATILVVVFSDSFSRIL